MPVPAEQQDKRVQVSTPLGFQDVLLQALHCFGQPPEAKDNPVVLGEGQKWAISFLSAGMACHGD